MITALLWALDDSEYPWVIQKVLSGVSLIVALCSTTYFLCNYILPKEIHRNRILIIFIQLVLLCFVQAFLLWIFQEGIVLLEARHILPISQFTHERETFLVTLSNSVPATILVNLGFGGLKFYYEHGKLYQQHLNLQKAHGLLNDNGIIIIETPNIDGLFPKISKIITSLSKVDLEVI